MLALSLLAFWAVGAVALRADCPGSNGSIVAHTGTPLGKESKQEGGTPKVHPRRIE